MSKEDPWLSPDRKAGNGNQKGLSNNSARQTGAFQSFIKGPVILGKDRGLGFSSNQFGFTVQSGPGLAVVIEISTNLSSWTPVQTNLAGSFGQVLFSDPQSGLSKRRFYRARNYP